MADVIIVAMVGACLVGCLVYLKRHSGRCDCPYDEECHARENGDACPLTDKKLEDIERNLQEAEKRG